MLPVFVRPRDKHPKYAAMKCEDYGRGQMNRMCDPRWKQSINKKAAGVHAPAGKKGNKTPIPFLHTAQARAEARR